MKILSRRSAILGFLACLLPGFGWLTPVARGQNGPPISPGGLDLQTALEKGLKARRPEEFQFIANVVQMVDDGTLPQSMVVTSFLWARRHRPYPYPYFEFGLQTQAAQIGVRLNSTYQQP